MASARHTLGPWMADSGTFAVVSSKGQVAECGDCLDMSVAERAANAALIAAAPDLLAALKALVCAVDGGEECIEDERLAACRAAIARAEGLAS